MSYGNYDLPEALETDLMIDHLERLRSDQSVELPVYDMISNFRKRETEIVQLIVAGSLKGHII